MPDSPPHTTLSALNPLPFFLHKHANFRKLATKEDPFHIHKTLGILSILSFIYRYGVVYPQTGTLGFDGSWFDWATMLVHNCLAFSSIQFRVPSKRIDTKPMVIYEEYRQHAMVFTNRCFAVFIVAIFWGGSPPVWAAPLAVALHHLMADDITRRHGSGNTAVRSVSKKLQTSTFYKRVGYLYSFYQYLAIASHIVPHERLADAGYNTIIAIASSAFMMTLYRKKIIRGRTHMIVYSFCLLLSAYHIVRMTGIWVAVLTALAFAARVNSRANKYAIWTVFRFIVAALPLLPFVAGA
eukprot:jgi/Bigna1/146441/aug1.114_g21149